MKRRSFLKGLLGVGAMPVIGKAALSPAESPWRFASIDRFRIIESPSFAGKCRMAAERVASVVKPEPDAIWSDKLLGEWYGKGFPSHPDIIEAQTTVNQAMRNALDGVATRA